MAVRDRTASGWSRERWMGLAFALGSTCFFLGPFPGYAALVGAAVVGVTFFVGSLLFTAGGAVQTWLAAEHRSVPGAGRAQWWTATAQLAGTVFFNVSTFRSMSTVLSDAGYDRLVWRPDAFGSICFLVSGVIAYRASARHGMLPSRGTAGWWEPAVNLLGCLLFGVSAVAGYVVPASATMIGQAAANWNTAAGAACFLTCAVASLSRRPDQGRPPARGWSPSPERAG